MRSAAYWRSCPSTQSEQSLKRQVHELNSNYEGALLIQDQHNRYALYHPSAEALSSMIVDLPYKITNSIVVNSTLYCKRRQHARSIRGAH
jgi:ABC-type multidrug transport system permease subunit